VQVNTGLNIEALEYFNKATEDPGREARLWKEETGGKVIGFFLTDVPEELVHAAGFFPFGIYGGNKGINLADAHMQAWTCSYVRSSLAMALGGALNFLDGLVIPQRCDETRMVMGIWKHQRPLSFMDNFRPPRQVERPSVKNYYLGELRRFKNKLEEFRGSEITDEELERSIRLYNRNRTLLGKLFDLHRQDPSLLSSRELYNVIRASMIIPREKLNQLLTQLLDTLGSKVSKEADRRIKVFISGTYLEPLEIADYIEENGGTIVGDDLKNGSRYFDGNVLEEGDLLQNLVERQLSKIPSASFDTSVNPRKHFLVKDLQEKNADGVILLHLKYCEPENFDYYDMKQALEKAGIPVQKIETEFGETSLGQLRTRVQAFMEMLGGVDLL
jgi:bcr-type benzoyl-CoA reductase subunit C